MSGPTRVVLEDRRVVAVFLTGGCWAILCSTWADWLVAHLDDPSMQPDNAHDRRAEFLMLRTLLEAAKLGASPLLDQDVAELEARTRAICARVGFVASAEEEQALRQMAYRLERLPGLLGGE